MEPTRDELAGVADLFAAVSRSEFHRAFENVAAREGSAFDPDALDARIDEARRAYYLVGVDRGGETVFAPGPAALPTLPEHGADLPHMMDVPERELDPETLANAVEDRLDDDAREAITEGDADRIRELLDTCYDAQAWGPVEVEELRERLAGAAEEL